MNAFSIIYCLIFLSLFSFAQSAETDNFTGRYLEIEDALPLINRDLNRRIKLALDEVIKQADNQDICDWSKLESSLGKYLRQPFHGQLEDFITQNDFVKKTASDLETSIFKSLSFLYSFPIKLGTWLGIGFTSSILHDGLLIGADKFGHFIDEGYYYYYFVTHWDMDFEDVIKMGHFLEYTFEGKLTGGIYSFADLAANYDGHQFWFDLLGPATKERKTKYFSCSNSQWKIEKEVDLSEYISASWDEGMNCNEYRSQEMEERIKEVIGELEQRDNKRYTCPVYPERVAQMINRYHDHAKSLIHPSILNFKK